MNLPAKFICLALVATSCVAIQTKSAIAAFGITSVTGGIEVVTGPPGPNVHPGSNEGPLPIVFYEVSGVIAPGGLDVDHDGSNVTASPAVTGGVVHASLVDTTLAAGTPFNSYLFHFDPAAIPGFGGYETEIVFDNKVIGVQLFSSAAALEKPAANPYVGTLEQGDAQVALSGGPPLIYYPGGDATRGLEEDSFLQLSIFGNSVTLIGASFGAEIDQVRILTGIPEPASGLAWSIILLVGCGAVAGRRA
jgi:hypothetical protein